MSKNSADNIALLNKKHVVFLDNARQGR